MRRAFALSLSLCVIGCGASAKPVVVTQLAAPTTKRDPKPNEVTEGAAKDESDQDALGDLSETSPKETHEPDPHVARQKALDDAAEMGMIGLLNAGADDQNLSAILSGLANGSSGGVIGNLPSAGGLGAAGVVPGGGVGTGVVGKSGLRLRSSRTRGVPTARATQPVAPPKPPPPPTRVTLVKVTATGLSSDAVSGAFDRSDRAFRGCYEAELERNPDAEVRLSLEIGIEKDGRPSANRTVHSVPADAELDKCALKAMSEMAFAHPVTEASAKLEVMLQRPPGGHLE